MDRDPVVRDSAGVTIVEHSWDPAEATPEESRVPWRLADEPALELGRMEGAGPDLFGDIQDVTRLPSGDVAVADNQATEIRVFDREGEHLRTMGGEGQGPGEFQWVWRIEGLPGDTVLAFDPMTWRVSRFDGAGDFVASFRLDQASDGPGTVQSVLGDGRLVVQSVTPDVEGDDRMAVTFRVVEPGGEDVHELGRFAGADFDGAAGQPVPLSGSVAVAAADSLVWVGESHRFDLRSYTPDGALRSAVRLQREPRPLTGEDVDDILAHMEEDPDAPPQLVEMIADVGFADRLPHHGSILVDEAGHLWVERFQLGANMGGPPPAERAETWDVFQPDGTLAGSLTLPAGFETHRAGDDYVLGVHTDDLGVERVRLYALERER